jgi:hypothetical protein
MDFQTVGNLPLTRFSSGSFRRRSWEARDVPYALSTPANTTPDTKNKTAGTIQGCSSAGITSKRRSPWLCPAPSGGAGLFLFSDVNFSLDFSCDFYQSHEMPRFSTSFDRIPARSLHDNKASLILRFGDLHAYGPTMTYNRLPDVDDGSRA